MIHAYTGGTLVTTAQTDENGQYAFTAAKTDFRLVFSKDGYVSQELNVAWSDDLSAFRVNAELLTEYAGVSLQADRSASLSGSLVNQMVEWASTTTVQVVGMKSLQESPLVTGFFEFAALRSGQYFLTVSAQGHLVYNATILIENGANTLDPIVLVLESEAPEAAVYLSGSAFLDDQQNRDSTTLCAGASFKAVSLQTVQSPMPMGATALRLPALITSCDSRNLGIRPKS